MSQNKQILEYLEKHPKGITPIEALWNFNCFRLASRIYDIRSMIPRDKEIVTERETRNGKTYAKYILENKV